MLFPELSRQTDLDKLTSFKITHFNHMLIKLGESERWKGVIVSILNYDILNRGIANWACLSNMEEVRPLKE